MGAGVARPLAIASALAALVVGCAPASPPPPPPPTPPVARADLAIGAPDGSTGAMVPFTDGQQVELVAGAQGGFHVWLEYALRDLPPGFYTLERNAHRVSDDAVVLRYTGTVEVGAPAGDGWWTAPSPIPMFMCPTPIGISIVGEPIAFLLRVLDDAGGELARAGVTLVPRCPAAQLDFCTRICTG
jgi:hypothetical protein